MRLKGGSMDAEQVFGVAVLVIGVVVLASLIMALPTMLLWNWLMPTIFGLCKLSFWQALGVNLLSGMLFKSYSIQKSS